MRSNLYRRIFPATRISSAKDTETAVMTTARGSRLATSVGGTLTGRGGDLLIIDDPLKPQDAHSESARESLKQWYSNTLLSRLDHKTEGSIILVMQRLHPDDLAGHLLEQGGWAHLTLPAIAEEDSIVRLNPSPPSGWIEDFHLQAVDHARHTEKAPPSCGVFRSRDGCAQSNHGPVPNQY